jgi:hypothetical protein
MRQNPADDGEIIGEAMKIDYRMLLKQARAYNRSQIDGAVSGKTLVGAYREDVQAKPDRLKVKSAVPESVRVAEPFSEIITPEELAIRLKVPPGWVYEKRRPRCKNPIPAVPLGKIIRFDWAAVVVWLQEQVKKDAAGIERRHTIRPVRRLRKEKTMA